MHVDLVEFIKIENDLVWLVILIAPGKLYLSNSVCIFINLCLILLYKPFLDGQTMGFQ